MSSIRQRNCDVDCLEECESTIELSDSYWDEYVFLTDNSSMTPRNHIALCSLLKELEDWIDSSDYDHIYLNGGDDSLLAAEMYRMLMLLEKDVKQLRKLEQEMRNERGTQQTRYSLLIDSTVMSRKKQSKVLKAFMRDHKTFYVETRQRWVTADVFQWRDWIDSLNSVLDAKVDERVEMQCPKCEKIEEEKSMHRKIDKYKYFKKRLSFRNFQSDLKPI